MQRKIFDKENHAFFVTFSCYRRRKLLNTDKAKRIVLHFLSVQLRNQNGTCAGFVIMPDHVHALVRFKVPEKLSTFMSQWKRRSSIQIKRLFQTVFSHYQINTCEGDPVWQAKYYVFNVYSESKAKEKIVYMHNNPVRSELVNSPEEWMYSSARWYADKQSVGIPIAALT